MPIRIFIADDHAVFRSGLKMLLEKETDLEVVGETGNGFDTIRAVSETDLDVLLLDVAMPDPGHSVSGLFDPIKSAALTVDKIGLLKDQIKGIRQQDIRNLFGFMLDFLCKGGEPSTTNIGELFSSVWDRAPEDLRKTAGIKYHTLVLDPNSDDSADKGAEGRLLDLLIKVGGIQYIPDGARARLYRHAARQLAKAKDSAYGWSSEETAAKTLRQFGAFVPSIAFEEVYQEILAVWCGNYWGRSAAHSYLGDFLSALNTDQIRAVIAMFAKNKRVRDELFQEKPKQRAIDLLNTLKNKLTIEAHKSEADQAVKSIAER